MTIAVWMLLLTSTDVQASGGRWLPSGELSPSVVQKIYTSPRGEVQFTQSDQTHSAFLRTNTGALAGLQEVQGNLACQEWLLSNKEEALLPGCDFVFRDDNLGIYLSVRSEEMEEASLFQALHGTMRGRERHVAL